MELILYILNETFKYIKMIKDKVNMKNIKNKISEDFISTVFHFNYIESYIYKIFSNEQILFNQKKSSKVLSSFILNYISFKEILKTLKNSTNEYLQTLHPLPPLDFIKNTQTFI